MAAAPTNPIDQLRRVLTIFGAVIAALLVLLAVILGLLYVRGERPPFEYLDSAGRPVRGNVTTYQAEDSLLCPGEPLRVVISFRVNEVPLTIRREYAVRPVVDGIPGRLIKAGNFDPIVRDVEAGASVPYTVAGTTVGPARYVLPLPDLAPGRYIYEVVSSADDRPDNAFHVGFEVEACE